MGFMHIGSIWCSASFCSTILVIATPVLYLIFCFNVYFNGKLVSIPICHPNYSQPSPIGYKSGDRADQDKDNRYTDVADIANNRYNGFIPVIHLSGVAEHYHLQKCLLKALL